MLFLFVAEYKRLLHKSLRDCLSVVSKLTSQKIYGATWCTKNIILVEKTLPTSDKMMILKMYCSQKVDLCVCVFCCFFSTLNIIVTGSMISQQGFVKACSTGLQFCALAADFTLFCDKHLILSSLCEQDYLYWTNTWARPYCDQF